MNRNLNPQEFGDHLFDPTPYTLQGPPAPPKVQPLSAGPQDYPDPHDAAGVNLTAKGSPNPVYREDATEGLDLSKMGAPKEDWIPTYEIGSIQSAIHEPSVQHLTEHGTGLGEGNATIVRGGGKHTLFDANHRLNAGLRRGQMIIPADVYDV